MRLPALEKNILKYRALQMTLILFRAESIKEFIVGSIRATDRMSYKKNSRLPEGTKNIVQKALEILIDERILTKDESVELKALIDYRNDIAHRIYLMTCDIIHPEKPDIYFLPRNVKYDYDALSKYEYYRQKIAKGLQPKFAMSISLDSAYFENAEETYNEELIRLRKKITRQLAIRKKGIDRRKTR